MSRLERLASLDEYSILSSNSSSHHDSGGCGQAKSTWTRDQEDCHRMDKRLTDVVAVGRTVRIGLTL